MLGFAELVILTGGFLSQKAKLFWGLLVIGLFWGINFFFLVQADRKQIPENLKSIEDYISALRHWQKWSNPFRQEVRTAIQQLIQFSQSQKALLAFQQDFQPVSRETEQFLLSNMKKILHSLLLQNPHETILFRKLSLQKILQQNETALLQYNAFLTELFQLDSQEMPCLSVMTSTLQKLRNPV